MSTLLLRLCFVSFATSLGCVPQTKGSPGETKDERKLVEVAEVTRQTISSYIETTSNLVAENHVVIVAEQPGRLRWLGVDEGMEVARGELLASLSASDAKLAVRTAEIKAQSALADHERTDWLAGRGLVGKEELERLAKERELAAQAVAEAKWKLDRARMRSPIDGRVTRRHKVVGAYVQTGDPIVEITNFSPLIADLYVPERDALQLELGREAELVLQAKSDVEFTGRVHRIAATVDDQSGTVRVGVEVEHPPDEVRSGSFVTVRIVRQRVEAALTVPREAVLRDGEGPYVFVVVQGRAEKRRVEPGIEQGADVQLVEGAADGDQVVVVGHGALRPGSLVRIAVSPTKTARAD